MDLDDFVEDLIPKKTKKALKKMKKRVKKVSLWTLFLNLLRSLFGSKSEKPERSISAESQSRPAPSQAPLRYDAISQAYQYRDRIEAMALSSPPDSIERMRLDALSQRVYDWTVAIEEIVKRSDFDHEDALLAQQRSEVPKAIKRLEKQLDATDDPALKAKLERTLSVRRKQRDEMARSSNQRQIAELKVEHALAQLGIIYAQLVNGQQLSERSSYERLSAEINEEALMLEDYLHALDEVTTPNINA